MRVNEVGGFLINTALTVAFIGIPTLAHWLWTGRTHPIGRSYSRVLLYIARWFGTVYAAVAVLLLLVASADLLRGGGHYPRWSLLFLVVMVSIGLTVRWMAGLWLTPPRG